MSDPISELVARSQGVVLRRELREVGLNKYRLRQQIIDGEWRESGRRVVLHRTAPDGLLTNTFIAAKLRPSCPLTGASAALLRPHPAWNDINFKTEQALIISDRSTGGNWRDVVHPGAGWDRDERTGLLIADALTTMIDLLRFLKPGPAAAVAGAANRAGMTAMEGLSERVRRLDGKPGVPQLRELVKAMIRGAESAPEIDLQHALRKAGFRKWTANPTVTFGERVFRPDVAFPKERVALEYQGYEAHSGRRALARDSERHNEFTFADWLVLYLTFETLYNKARWESFCDHLAHLLLRRNTLQIPAQRQIPRVDGQLRDL